MDENKNTMPPAEDFFPEEPPMPDILLEDMPELDLMQDDPMFFESEIPEESTEEAAAEPEAEEAPVILAAEISAETVTDEEDSPILFPEPEIFPVELPEEVIEMEELLIEEPADPQDTGELPIDEILLQIHQDEDAHWAATVEDTEEFLTQEPAKQEAPAPKVEPKDPRYHGPRKGRPKRKGGYGLFGLPHLAATLVWLVIIVMIGTSLGRMIWVCAADVLAFGRESKQVTVTITSNDTIDDIAQKLHDAQLIRYPEVFKLYAKLAVDEGDILPGTFQLDTIYDYHALVVQMGPRSSTRSVVEDLLIPEGLNCRQIFELLEQKNICTVRELEEYAASGEFSDFWFLEGVERGDKYCLEGFLFPDTYDFYEHSTPREALGKMLLGFQARVKQDETMAALGALNERLSAMMRANGCSEAYIAENQLSLRDLLIVASLVEEETASSKESPLIASVIFNRLTQDQIYERYLGIDAAIIYATGDADNIDTSIDHPYNTYKYAGLTPGPISNPGLDSINAVLYFESSDYYYYILNPETRTSDFSKTLGEHEQKVQKYYGGNG